jgi:cell wall-associated NlpC family hydrolase
VSRTQAAHDEVGPARAARARGRPSGALARRALLALSAAAVAAILATLLLAGGGHRSRAASATARGRAATGAVAHASAAAAAAARARRAGGEAHAAPTSASGAVATRRRPGVSEVPDPEEAESFPAPAGVRHRAAATPAKAADFVAAGAPSDAEVRSELAQMRAIERSARQAQRQRLQPVPGGRSIGGDGTIPVPANVPEAVQRVIAGANAIANFPYVFGGGHASFVDNAYDCSGSVSYALAAGGLLSAPLTSGDLESWGVPGPGRYITVLANAGHTYMYVDGILYNTSGRSGVYASRWQVGAVDNGGYVARHWPGL